MTHKISYTVDATSGVVDRLGSTIDKAAKFMNTNRVKKLQEVQKRIDNLRSRGLLNKQEYVSVSTSEFERMHYSQR